MPVKRPCILSARFTEEDNARVLKAREITGHTQQDFVYVAVMGYVATLEDDTKIEESDS